MNSADSIVQTIPNNILQAANDVIENLLPDKSRDKYLETYNKFMVWKESENVAKTDCSETVLLAYFNKLSMSYKSSSLWAYYSMLKTTIERNDNVQINYPKLIAFLKKLSVGHVAKKSEAFEPEHIRRFLLEARDEDFLVCKVVLIFGVYGATRVDELTKVAVCDVKEHGDIFVVKIPLTKTDVSRTFTVADEYASYLRKYIALRPPNAPINRFLLNHQKGKCTVQPIGRNKFLGMPKVIASFLGLPNILGFTGHSFRRTSATLLADGGGDSMQLRCHGGWRSSSVAESYVQDSVSNKRKIGTVIAGQIEKIESVTSITQSQSIITASRSVMTDNSSVTCDLPENDVQQQLKMIPENDNDSPEGKTDGSLKMAKYSRVAPDDFMYSNQFNNCTVTITYK